MTETRSSVVFARAPAATARVRAVAWARSQGWTISETSTGAVMERSGGGGGGSGGPLRLRVALSPAGPALSRVEISDEAAPPAHAARAEIEAHERAVRAAREGLMSAMEAAG